MDLGICHYSSPFSKNSDINVTTTEHKRQAFIRPVLKLVYFTVFQNKIKITSKK